MECDLSQKKAVSGNKKRFTIERAFVWSCWAVLLGVVVMIITPLELYHANGYTCANTGSRKGHNLWFWGTQTDHSYSPSPIETFMLEHHPEELKHRWVKTAGTGKNVFGRSVSHGHGRTPMTRLRFALRFAEYWEQLSNERLYSLYQQFSIGTDEEVTALIQEIEDECIDFMTANP